MLLVLLLLLLLRKWPFLSGPFRGESSEHVWNWTKSVVWPLGKLQSMMSFLRDMKLQPLICLPQSRSKIPAQVDLCVFIWPNQLSLELLIGSKLMLVVGLYFRPASQQAFDLSFQASWLRNDLPVLDRAAKATLLECQSWSGRFVKLDLLRD